MKKALSLILALVLCLSLCACGSEKGTPNTTTSAPTGETLNEMDAAPETASPVEDQEPTIPNNGEWDEILCSGDDYHLVKKAVDTFEEYKVLYGVVNSKGEWVQELTEEGSFVKGVIFRSQGSSKTLLDTSCFTYLGEGFFLASPGVTVVEGNREYRIGPWENSVSYSPTGRPDVAIWECLIWNVVNNVQLEFDASRISTFQDGYSFFCSEDDHIGQLVTGNGMLCVMNTMGEIKEFSCMYKPHHSVSTFPQYSEGLFFAYTEKYIPGFFDIEGNLVINLSEYRVSWDSFSNVTGKNAPYFEDGKFTFLANNEGGSTYKVTIDKTGSRIGEPEKVS